MCAVNRHLQEMSRDGLQHMFGSWCERRNKCKVRQGRYFEKKNRDQYVGLDILVHEIIDVPCVYD